MGQAIEQRHRVGYWVLFAGLPLLALVTTVKELWYYDFWNYASFVRELQAHPFSPNDSFVKGVHMQTPYWPYLVIVSFVARLTTLSTFVSLSLMGVVNMLLLAWALHFFCVQVYGRRYLAFYALLFILSLWGKDAWFFSNFFHIRGLPYVMSYPASFALALTFFALGLYSKFLKMRGSGALLAVIALTLCVLLTHPITALFLLVGLCALTLSRWNFRELSCWGYLAIILGISLGGAAIWPYFPLFQSLSGTGYLPPQNRTMYVNVWVSTYPLVLTLPAVIECLCRDRRNPLFLTALGLFILYVYGIVSDHGTFGRVISFIGICLQILLAQQLLTVEQRCEQEGQGKFAKLIFIGCTVLPLLIILPAVLNLFVRPHHDKNPCYEVSQLAKHFSQEDVVLTDHQTALCIPSLGPRLVSVFDDFSLPRGFLKDRIEATETFFRNDAMRDEKTLTLQKYDVSLVLFNRNFLPSNYDVLETARPLGDLLHEDSHLVLVRIQKTPLDSERVPGS